MIKIVGGWKKSSTLTEEQCEMHYRTVHTALARIALGGIPGFRKYVQNKVLSATIVDFNDADKSHPCEPAFDRSIEIHFDSMEDLQKAFESPEMRACFNDHKNFMEINTPGNVWTYVVEELVALKRDEYTGQLCYPQTLADDPVFKEKFAKAVADKEAGKPWPW